MLREKIAGEITLSEEPGATIKKWRTLFGISQKDLAEALSFSTSVVSDYESGRRQSPGVQTVRKMVDGLLSIDMERGGEIIKKFEVDIGSEAILGMGEFPKSVNAQEFCKLLDCKVENADVDMDRQINGYTVIDSLKAITQFSSSDYLKLYGWSTERALLFSGVKFGRSPMIAVRAHPMKPAIVVYIQPENIDDLAIRLASLENIILLSTQLPASQVMERIEVID